MFSFLRQAHLNHVKERTDLLLSTLKLKQFFIKLKCPPAEKATFGKRQDTNSYL